MRLTLMILQTKTEKNIIQIGYKFLIIHIIGSAISGQTNSLFNLINHQPEIEKIYLYAKDPYEAKYQFLINKRENRGLKH